MFPDQRCAGRNYYGQRCCNAAPLRPRASVARATATILVTGGNMTGELVCGCGVAEVLCDSDDQCEGPGHWLERCPVKLI